MAKQIGIYRYIGKMGQSVGFSNANASKAGTKFVREKAASISNPRTYAQARQRAKVRPAALFYNAFVDVLNHAFIPNGRESKNRLRFMQLAMKLGVPNVYKDENVLPFNLPYQISEGTLGVSSLCKVGTTAADDGAVVFPNFIAPAGWDDAASIRELTIADFASAVIAANPQLVAGEELTCLAILQSVNDPNEQIPAFFSIVLDTADTLTTVGDMVGNRLSLWVDTSAGADVAIFGLASGIGLYKIVAGGLIISHKTASTWNYTNSFLGISAYGEQIGWDEEDIIASYMEGAKDFDSSKVLQQANNGQQQGVVPVSGENVAYSVTDAPEGATYNYATAAVVTMSDGQRRVVVDNSGNLVSYQNGEFVTILQTIDGTATPLPKSATSWSGVNALSVSEVAAVPFNSEVSLFWREAVPYDHQFPGQFAVVDQQGRLAVFNIGGLDVMLCAASSDIDAIDQNEVSTMLKDAWQSHDFATIEHDDIVEIVGTPYMYDTSADGVFTPALGFYSE